MHSILKSLSQSYTIPKTSQERLASSLFLIYNPCSVCYCRTFWFYPSWFETTAQHYSSSQRSYVHVQKLSGPILYTVVPVSQHLGFASEFLPDFHYEQACLQIIPIRCCFDSKGFLCSTSIVAYTITNMSLAFSLSHQLRWFLCISV